jgi:hypothetical protein
MTDIAVGTVFLGAIAVAAVTMAASHVAVVLIALRTARRGSELAQRLQHDIRPIVEHVQLAAADAATTTALAAAHVQHLDQTVRTLASGAEHVLGIVQTIARPVGRLSLLLVIARALRARHARGRMPP